jgi:hypothetical protein
MRRLIGDENSLVALEYVVTLQSIQIVLAHFVLQTMHSVLPRSKFLICITLTSQV